jgi:hypothetical protein
MKLLHGEALSEAIRSLLNDEDDLRCAVAFWGPVYGRIARVRGAKVILDTSMRCTSRVALAALGVKRGKQSSDVAARVRVLDGLHAKVFIGDRTAIICSANASANALGDNDRPPALKEAGIVVRRSSDPELHRQAVGIWEDYLERSRPVTGADLNRAPAVAASAAARDRAGAGAAASSILDAVLRRPEDFASTVFVFADHPIGATGLARAIEAYESKHDKKPVEDGRSRICRVNVGDEADVVLRTSSNAIMFWLADPEGLFAYHDLDRVEHGRKRVTYFGRRGWSSVRSRLGLARLTSDAAFRNDRDAAASFAKLDGDRRGERFVTLTGAQLSAKMEGLRADDF